MSDIAITHVQPQVLQPAPYNPRKMTADARRKLRAGIQAFGLVDPIIARASDNLVIGGHQRLSIALELGMTTVPVVYIECDDQQAAALNVLLNNQSAAGEWEFGSLTDLLSTLDAEGFDATLTGFDADELARMLGTDIMAGDAPALKSGDRDPIQQMTFTLHGTQAETVRLALEAAKRDPRCGADAVNENSNGNALAVLCAAYLESRAP